MSSREAVRSEAVADGTGIVGKKNSSSKRDLALRILITIAALAIWFWTQSLLGARSAPSAPIGDGLHRLTASLNSYFQSAPRAANALLIISSALIDAIAIFLLGSWIFAGRLRPFLGLGILLATDKCSRRCVHCLRLRELSGTIRDFHRC